ncbi:hypothetical protein C8R46DRAFT_1244902 [Mycena filopes]|nr:hypothetical protein C8R46DRAFT_1244902 [Mycena filopes]
MSLPPGRNPRQPTPFVPRPRRTLIACTICRQRKVRCISTERPPKGPCARCKKKGLVCEYVATAPPEHSPQTPEFPDESDAGSASASASPQAFDSGVMAPPPLPLPHPPHRPRYPAAASSSSSSSSRPDLDLAPPPPLPYTRAPPTHHRPRYSGAPYPDLSTTQYAELTPGPGYYSNAATLPINPDAHSQARHLPPPIGGYFVPPPQRTMPPNFPPPPLPPLAEDDLSMLDWSWMQALDPSGAAFEGGGAGGGGEFRWGGGEGE